MTISVISTSPIFIIIIVEGKRSLFHLCLSHASVCLSVLATADDDVLNVRKVESFSRNVRSNKNIFLTMYIVQTAPLAPPGPGITDNTGADLGFYKGGCPVHLKGAPQVDPAGCPSATRL